MIRSSTSEVAKVHTVCPQAEVQTEVLFQLLYSSESNKVQALKCSQSIKVKSLLLKNISTVSCFLSKLTGAHVIFIYLRLKKVESVGFVPAVPKRTTACFET